jgi:hypothetical protein
MVSPFAWIVYVEILRDRIGALGPRSYSLRAATDCDRDREMEFWDERTVTEWKLCCMEKSVEQFVPGRTGD